ncbi:MAG: tyrosine-type recombinase/integrase, partial [Chloroflexota bacterium]
AREPMRYRTYGLGTPWGPDLIGKYFVEEIGRMGLPKIRLHDLRHTHATILLAEDGNVKMIAARLGHDPAVLLRTYAHYLPEHETRAVARCEAAFANTQKTTSAAV